MSTPQTAPSGRTSSAKRAAMMPEPTPISRTEAPDSSRSRLRIAFIFSAFFSRDETSRDSYPARGGPSAATLLPRERHQGNGHLAEASDLDLDRVEGREHLTEGVLGETPVIGRLVVIRVEMRHGDHDCPSRLEGAMHATDSVFDLEDVLQDVQAEDDVERLLEGHRPNVHDLVPELRVDIGLDELRGGAEEAPEGEGIPAQVVTAASNLENPLSGNAGGELLQIASDPRPSPEEQVDDSSESRLREAVSIAHHGRRGRFEASAADWMSSTNRAPRASTLQSSARRLAPSSRAARNASSESTPSIARASSAVSPGVTSTPLRPSSTASSIPAKREATIARPAAIASRRTMGTPSWSPEAAVTEGTTKTSASRSARPRSWRPTCPRKRTGRPSAAASRRSRHGPSPMTSSDHELVRRRRTASSRT